MASGQEVWRDGLNWIDVNACSGKEMEKAKGNIKQIHVCRRNKFVKPESITENKK